MNKQLYIEFDRKSLVIPQSDFEILKTVNYKNDKFSSAFFPQSEKCKNDLLIILDRDNNPNILIFFKK